MKDGIISEAAIVVFENEKWGATVMEAVIGKNGVSQEAKQSLASRVSEFLNLANWFIKCKNKGS